jgi:hypothetical protein
VSVQGFHPFGGKGDIVSQRRELKLACLDDVKREVEKLLAGHKTVGQWTLGQMCHHLAVIVRYSSSAPAAPEEPTEQQAAWRERFFAAEKFPEGRSAPVGLEPKPGLDDADEVGKLCTAIDRFTSMTGPCATHPMLGPLSRDQWARFHCLHAAHHLGFAVPT